MPGTGRSTPSRCSAPAAGVSSEEWGFEDPRVVWIPELGTFVITCTAYGPAGPAVYLATTDDFSTVKRHGIIMHPDDKNAALLPERIDGSWVLLHRPKTEFGGARGEILLSRSPTSTVGAPPNASSNPVSGAWWDSVRIGMGPPPRRTEHRARCSSTTASRKPSPVRSTVLRPSPSSTRTKPTRVLKRLPHWVLAPEEPHERVGDVPNVVFPCGLVHDVASGELHLDDGAADSTICLATARLDELVDALLVDGVDD